MTIFAPSIAKILSKISTNVWNKIVMDELEFKLRDQLKRYGFGKFATLMIAIGLNDYQFKEPAERVYWSEIHEIIKNKSVPKTTKELEELLAPFYENKRLHRIKIKRLQKFLNSCITYISGIQVHPKLVETLGYDTIP
jgi:N-glycosylase/DNA lyase